MYYSILLKCFHSIVLLKKNKSRDATSHKPRQKHQIRVGAKSRDDDNGKGDPGHIY